MKSYVFEVVVEESEAIKVILDEMRDEGKPVLVGDQRLGLVN